MVVVSIKGVEWIVKARIVFRGDAVRDEENQAAVLDDIAASAPTSLGGLKLTVAYGLLDGNESPYQRLHQGLRAIYSEFIPTYLCAFTHRVGSRSC